MQRKLMNLTAGLLLGLASPVVLADHHEGKKVVEQDGWTSLIGDEGIEGWATKDAEKYWKLEDGMIVGDNPDKKESRLWTQAQFGDYELVVQYKTPSEDYDSGVFLHGESHQVQIGVSRSLKIDLTGALYCPKDGNGKYPQQPLDTIKATHKLGQWNTLRIVTQGKQITTWLNGEQINDYTAVKYPEKGPIGLQLHGGVHQTMHFKTIKIKPIGE